MARMTRGTAPRVIRAALLSAPRRDTRRALSASVSRLGHAGGSGGGRAALRAAPSRRRGRLQQRLVGCRMRQPEPLQYRALADLQAAVDQFGHYVGEQLDVVVSAQSRGRFADNGVAAPG